MIVISTDKGLCGALNTNLLREAAKAEAESAVFVAVGRKASQFVARTRRELSAEFTCKDVPEFADARAIAKYASELFLKDDVNQVDVLFTNFISTLNQRPERRPFLPSKRDCRPRNKSDRRKKRDRMQNKPPRVSI